MANELDYQQSFNSFSGTDLHLLMKGTIIGEAQGVSWTSTREKAPIYTMGSSNPRSFSRGKRGIAGSLVSVLIDRSAILATLQEKDELSYVANKYEVRPGFVRSGLDSSTPQLEVGSVGTTAGNGASTANQVRAAKTLAKAQYLDQLMPISISLIGANEYGSMMSMHILGIEFLNNGSMVSIDNMVTDESATFVATDILPWGDQKFIRGTNVLNTKVRNDIPRAGGGFAS